MAGLFEIVMCGLWWPPRGVSSRALGKREGARRRQVVEDHAENVGRVRSERK